mmetsp:Transcript_23975/g.41990  ORF Transcript_23975/g.41990 Transcript_23975/m.41990 type:complete len:93 (+) Transcript_23975:92-370(+)
MPLRYHTYVLSTALPTNSPDGASLPRLASCHHQSANSRDWRYLLSNLSVEDENWPLRKRSFQSLPSDHCRPPKALQRAYKSKILPEIQLEMG